MSHLLTKNVFQIMSDKRDTRSGASELRRGRAGSAPGVAPPRATKGKKKVERKEQDEVERIVEETRLLEEGAVDADIGLNAASGKSPREFVVIKTNNIKCMNFKVLKLFIKRIVAPENRYTACLYQSLTNRNSQFNLIVPLSGVLRADNSFINQDENKRNNLQLFFKGNEVSVIGEAKGEGEVSFTTTTEELMADLASISGVQEKVGRPVPIKEGVGTNKVDAQKATTESPPITLDAGPSPILGKVSGTDSGSQNKVAQPSDPKPFKNFVTHVGPRAIVADNLSNFGGLIRRHNKSIPKDEYFEAVSCFPRPGGKPGFVVRVRVGLGVLPALEALGRRLRHELAIITLIEEKGVTGGSAGSDPQGSQDEAQQ